MCLTELLQVAFCGVVCHFKSDAKNRARGQRRDGSKVEISWTICFYDKAFSMEYHFLCQLKKINVQSLMFNSVLVVGNFIFIAVMWLSAGLGCVSLSQPLQLQTVRLPTGNPSPEVVVKMGQTNCRPDREGRRWHSSFGGLGLIACEGFTASVCAGNVVPFTPMPGDAERQPRRLKLTQENKVTNLVKSSANSTNKIWLNLAYIKRHTIQCGNGNDWVIIMVGRNSEVYNF